MRIIGIDPGLDGAVCHMDGDGAVVEIHDIPVYWLKRGGKNKREIDAVQLSDLIEGDHAYLESVGVMPGQGISSMGSLMKGYGIIIGILARAKIPMTLVPARVWKSRLNVPAAKDGSRARASQLLPAAAHHWTRAKDDGRAEAAMIALWGLRSSTVEVSSPVDGPTRLRRTV